MRHPTHTPSWLAGLAPHRSEENARPGPSAELGAFLWRHADSVPALTAGPALGGVVPAQGPEVGPFT